MAIQVINVGSSANSGGGDPLRAAMIKINDNFSELYMRTGGELAQTIIGADSTILVDGPNSSLNANALSGTVPNDLINFSDLANPPDTIAGFGITDAYTKIQVYTKPETDDLLVAPRDLQGSLFADDSTLLVDGTNSKIVGAVDTTSLRTSEDRIALGDSAGATNQGNGAVAIGNLTGTVDQGSQATALGVSAGRERQGSQATALGRYAGQNDQGVSAVAVGHSAGRETQGTVAIAIGKLAGETNQAANSIVLNATGSALENTTASSLRIKPIRSATMTTILGYDAASGEVMHNAAIPGYINITDLKTLVAASADFADYQTRIAAL